MINAILYSGKTKCDGPWKKHLGTDLKRHLITDLEGERGK